MHDSFMILFLNMIRPWVFQMSYYSCYITYERWKVQYATVHLLFIKCETYILLSTALSNMINTF